MKKVISVWTSLCFLFSFILCDSLHAVIEIKAGNELKEQITEQLNDNGLNSIIPQNYGRVTQSSIFPTQPNPTQPNPLNSPIVINIQDLHCHPEVQRNISSILSTLDKKYHLGKVYVEGGYGDIDTSWLSNISNKELKKYVMESLLDKGLLTGTEYYSVISNQPNLLKGLEDEKLHKANIVRLGTLIEKKKYFESKLNGLEKDLKFMEQKYFNSDNVRLNRAISNYKSGNISARKYYKLLKKWVNKINDKPDNYNELVNINMSKYPNIETYIELLDTGKRLNYNRIHVQLQSFVQTLKSNLSYKDYNAILEKTDNFNRLDELAMCLSFPNAQIPVSTGTNPEFVIADSSAPSSNHRCAQINADKAGSDLKVFFDYCIKSRKINPLAMITEEKRLIEDIRIGFSKDISELEVSFLSDFFGYFKDYVLNTISADDYEYVLKDMDRFNKIWGKYAFKNRISELQSDMGILSEYYEANCKRNECFLKNVQSAWCGSQGKDSTSSIQPRASSTMISELLSNSEIIVMVTGGFHTEGLKKILLEKGINYITITPNVTKDTKESNIAYQEFARQQAKVFGHTSLALTLGSCDVKVASVNNNSMKIDISGQTIEFINKEGSFELKEELPGGELKIGEKIFNKKAIEEAINEAVQIASDMQMPSVTLIYKLLKYFAPRLSEKGILGSKGLIWKIASNPELQKIITENENITIEELSRISPLFQDIIKNHALASGGLIGGWEILTTPEYDSEKRTIIFTGRDINNLDISEETDIVLNVISDGKVGKEDLENIKSKLKKESGEKPKEIFNKIFSRFEKKDCGLLIFEDNTFDIDGIASHSQGDKDFIARSSRLKTNGVALFHEMTELMGASGEITLEEIFDALDKEHKKWYQDKLKEHKIEGPGHEKLKFHYISRAFDLQEFGAEDEILSTMIHIFKVLPILLKDGFKPISRRTPFGHAEYFDKYFTLERENKRVVVMDMSSIVGVLDRAIKEDTEANLEQVLGYGFGADLKPVLKEFERMYGVEKLKNRIVKDIVVRAVVAGKMNKDDEIVNKVFGDVSNLDAAIEKHEAAQLRRKLGRDALISGSKKGTEDTGEDKSFGRWSKGDNELMSVRYPEEFKTESIDSMLGVAFALEWGPLGDIGKFTIPQQNQMIGRLDNSSNGIVDISKKNKAEVLAALYNNANPNNLSHSEYYPFHVITKEEAEELLSSGETRFDYLYGRAMKINLQGNTINVEQFNINNGEGRAEAIISRLPDVTLIGMITPKIIDVKPFLAQNEMIEVGTKKLTTKETIIFSLNLAVDRIKGMFGGLLKPKSKDEGEDNEINGKGGLVGKWETLTTPVYDPAKKTISFMGKHIETGDEEEIILNVISDGKKDYQDITSHLVSDSKIVGIVLDWFNRQSDCKSLIFEYNEKYGIHGIASHGIINFIARSQILRDDGVLSFHEKSELMGAAGELTVEMILDELNEEKKGWYYEQIAKHGRENLKLHYAIRALQQQEFGAVDELLSIKIYNLKAVANFMSENFDPLRIRKMFTPPDYNFTLIQPYYPSTDDILQKIRQANQEEESARLSRMLEDLDAPLKLYDVMERYKERQPEWGSIKHSILGSDPANKEIDLLTPPITIERTWDRGDSELLELNPTEQKLSIWEFLMFPSILLILAWDSVKSKFLNKFPGLKSVIAKFRGKDDEENVNSNTGEKTGKGGLIGKYDILDPVYDSNAGTISFTGKHIETGEEKEIVLKTEGLDKSLHNKIILALEEKSVSKVVRYTLNWFKNDQAQLLVFEKNEYGIHGIAIPEYKNEKGELVKRSIIGVSQDLKDNPMTWLHEMTELMVSLGVIKVEMIVNELTNKNKGWYHKKIKEPGRGNLKAHYATCALEPQIDGDLNTLLTAYINLYNILPQSMEIPLGLLNSIVSDLSSHPKIAFSYDLPNINQLGPLAFVKENGKAVPVIHVHLMEFSGDISKLKGYDLVPLGINNLYAFNHPDNGTIIILSKSPEKDAAMLNNMLSPKAGLEGSNELTDVFGELINNLYEKAGIKASIGSLEPFISITGDKNIKEKEYDIKTKTVRLPYSWFEEGSGNVFDRMSGLWAILGAETNSVWRVWNYMLYMNDVNSPKELAENLEQLRQFRGQIVLKEEVFSFINIMKNKRSEDAVKNFILQTKARVYVDLTGKEITEDTKNKYKDLGFAGYRDGNTIYDFELFKEGKKVNIANLDNLDESIKVDEVNLIDNTEWKQALESGNRAIIARFSVFPAMVTDFLNAYEDKLTVEQVKNVARNLDRDKLPELSNEELANVVRMIDNKADSQSIMTAIGDSNIVEEYFAKIEKTNSDNKEELKITFETEIVKAVLIRNELKDEVLADPYLDGVLRDVLFQQALLPEVSDKLDETVIKDFESLQNSMTTVEFSLKIKGKVKDLAGLQDLQDSVALNTAKTLIVTFTERVPKSNYDQMQQALINIESMRETLSAA